MHVQPMRETSVTLRAMGLARRDFAPAAGQSPHAPPQKLDHACPQALIRQAPTGRRWCRYRRR